MNVSTRFEYARAVAEHYKDFSVFCEDAMKYLGFDITWMQADIAEYMHSGPRLRMVMAQRGEAKSTLAAIYAVWRVIQQCSTRVLVVSGGERQASEVAYLIIRLITTWDILEYLRPDRSAGDRSSVEGFDVHWTLKGVDKSPSVACVGVGANLPGKRADLLIADDVETTKSGLTATSREQLVHLTREFSSICTHGDILYLGTPQSKDSIYNTLPLRGFDIRVWPGRYPTEAEQESYMDRLAPSIVQRMQADPSLRTGGGITGLRGKASDPDRYTDEELCEKELDKGPEHFQLQYMLDSTLADALRQQLKLSDFVCSTTDWENLPEVVVHSAADKYLKELPKTFVVPMAKLYNAVPVDCKFQPAGMRRMYIDPAGSGADELAWGISTSLGPYIHVLEVAGVRGGMTDANVERLCRSIALYGVTDILCESNMGAGLFEIALRSELAKRGLGHVGVRGEYSTGQKEKRIISRLVSAMQRHRVVLHAGVFEADEECCKQYSIEQRMKYSLWHQVSCITTDRGSLEHDDRVEALAGAVYLWKDVLTLDDAKASKKREEEELRQFLNDPMGYGITARKPSGTRHTLDTRRRRRGL